MERRKSKTSALAMTLLLGATAVKSARADDAVADFYTSHPITFYIGFSAGNAFDLYGRAVAKYIGRYIPGHPTIIVQNMPGAGSVTAAQYIYNVAPKDGTAVGVFSRSTPMEPLLGNGNVKFDATRFSWIGSAAKETSVCVVRSASGVATWNDVFSKDLAMAATSLSADTGVFANVLKNEFGAKFKVVTGYPGGNEITQAIESGEVDGRCGWSWSGVKSAKPEWLRDGFIKVLIQLGLVPNAELADVPLVMDLAKTERQKQVLRLVFARQEFAWPFGAPPDVPPARLKALRAAFLQALSDPGLIEEAQKLSLEVSPLSGSEVESLIKATYETPKDLVQMVRTSAGAK
jgi:tripartite-type tricarboxylate transporter receptor subunit TctC